VVLRDGSAIVVWPLATGDVAAIAEWFEGLGPETRHARFLAGVTMLDAGRSRNSPRLTTATMRPYSDSRRAVAGIARYIRLQQCPAAEVAVAMADRWGGGE
jgi:hypothetical protein